MPNGYSGIPPLRGVIEEARISSNFPSEVYTRQGSSQGASSSTHRPSPWSAVPGSLKPPGLNPPRSLAAHARLLQAKFRLGVAAIRSARDAAAGPGGCELAESGSAAPVAHGEQHHSLHHRTLQTYHTYNCPERKVFVHLVMLLASSTCPCVVYLTRVRTRYVQASVTVPILLRGECGGGLWGSNPVYSLDVIYFLFASTLIL